MRQNSRDEESAVARALPPAQRPFSADLTHCKRRHVRGKPPNDRGEDHVHSNIHEARSRRKPGPSRRPQAQRCHSNEDGDHQHDRAVAVIGHGQRNHTEYTARAEGAAEPATQSGAHGTLLNIHAPYPIARPRATIRSSAPTPPPRPRPRPRKGRQRNRNQRACGFSIGPKVPETRNIFLAPKEHSSVPLYCRRPRFVGGSRPRY